MSGRALPYGSVRCLNVRCRKVHKRREANCTACGRPLAGWPELEPMPDSDADLATLERSLIRVRSGQLRLRDEEAQLLERIEIFKKQNQGGNS